MHSVNYRGYKKGSNLRIVLVGKGVNISQSLLMKNEKKDDFLFILLAHNYKIITASSGECYIK